MVRTQIQLTEEQAEKLKKLAARKRLSIAELVRQGVDAVLRAETISPEERKKRAIAAAGRFRSGVTDLSARHDEHLAEKARERWKELLEAGDVLVCSNYVLVETFALLQHRMGIEAVRTFQEDVVPVLTVEWADEAVHQAGVMGVLAASRKRLSLVDCVSFAIMRNLGIKTAFALDRHFREMGFTCTP
jgi:predicted nucleic acid-binding protein